jgi:hypothetical protein
MTRDPSVAPGRDRNEIHHRSVDNKPAFQFVAAVRLVVSDEIKRDVFEISEEVREAHNFLLPVHRVESPPVKFHRNWYGPRCKGQGFR